MKNFSLFLITVCALTFASTSTFAQSANNKGKDEKRLYQEENGRKTFEDDSKNTAKGKTSTHAENSKQENNGHAYGKKEQGLDKTISTAESKIKVAKEKTQKSKQALEKKRKSGKLSDEDYQKQKSKIENAESAINDLEQKVNRGKRMNSAD
ncbi:hypothetical protein [Chloroherpeton thalassium]|nr:hypothetical protein [Chloroherpeton thalassium]